MTRPSTLARAGVAAASLLIGGTLLVLPSSTHERSAPVTNAVMLAAQAPAAPHAEVAAAADRGAGPAQARRLSAPTPPASAGMMVGIDPETGQIGMPTPEQMQRLSEAQQLQVDHSDAGLVEIHHPDGSVSVDLQGRFQEYTTVRVGPDGKLTYQCVDGPENAKRVLESTAPAALEER